MSQNNTHNRGFASMDAEKQREIARKGGRAAHEKKTAHQFTPDEAREAGRKGGQSVSANRAHMAEIGRLGGKSSAASRRTSTSSDFGHKAVEDAAAGSEGTTARGSSEAMVHNPGQDQT